MEHIELYSICMVCVCEYVLYAQFIRLVGSNMCLVRLAREKITKKRQPTLQLDPVYASSYMGGPL